MAVAGLTAASKGRDGTCGIAHCSQPPPGNLLHTQPWNDCGQVERAQGAVSLRLASGWDQGGIGPVRPPPGVLASGHVETGVRDEDSTGSGDCSVCCQFLGMMPWMRWGGALTSRGTVGHEFQGTLAVMDGHDKGPRKAL